MIPSVVLSGMDFFVVNVLADALVRDLGFVQNYHTRACDSTVNSAGRTSSSTIRSECESKCSVSSFTSRLESRFAGWTGRNAYPTDYHTDPANRSREALCRRVADNLLTYPVPRSGLKLPIFSLRRNLHPAIPFGLARLG